MDPHEVIVKSAFRSSTGSFLVEASKTGEYKYCLSNIGAFGNSDKLVSFSINGPDEQRKLSEKASSSGSAKDEAKAGLETEVRELTEAIQKVTDEQAYIRQRLLRHHSILAALVATTQVAAFDWTLQGLSNGYTSFTSTLLVPPVPDRPATGDATYFYWPGLQTNSAAKNYQPIGFGVLQPVLTFGPACTPNQPAGASVYRGWHISAQYVNPSGTVAGHKGCMGGNMMDVSPGDEILMTMVLQGTTWVQTVTRQGVACSGPGAGVNSASGCQVSFSIDMQGQVQNRAELVLELYYQAVVTHNVVFSGITLEVLYPEPTNSTRFCTPTSRLQKTETCSGMSLSADKKTCTIQQCLFTAPAVVVVPPPVSAGSGTDGNGTPIAPGNVIPPPVDEPSSSDPNSPDAGTSDDSSGSSSGSTGSGTGTGAVAGPNNAVVSNSQSSTGGVSKTVLYGGAGAGAALIIAIGAFVMVRRNSKSKEEEEEANINLKHERISPAPHGAPKSSLDVSMTGRSPKAAYLESANGNRAASPMMRPDSRASEGRRTPGGSRNNRVGTQEVHHVSENSRRPSQSDNGRRPSATERYTPSGNSSRHMNAHQRAADAVASDSEDTDTEIQPIAAAVAISSNNSRRAPGASSSTSRHQYSRRSITTDDSNNEDTDLDEEAPVSAAVSGNSRRPRTSDVSSNHSRRPRTENSRDRSATASASGRRARHDGEASSNHRGRVRHGDESPVVSGRSGRERSASRG
ncbi:UNVERIFIED_CONTAM: hypothetical protein HDU68_010312 [Siphonaria sp. JEL0065]|nr:hypothetical protein HDU68_010312 [Siphonaria sp. JEL0065]